MGDWVVMLFYALAIFNLATILGSAIYELYRKSKKAYITKRGAFKLCRAAKPTQPKSVPNLHNKEENIAIQQP